MSLRVACDLDGTLADMESALEAEANRLFGPGVDLRSSLRARPEGPASVETPDPTASTPGMRRSVRQPSSIRSMPGVRLSDRQQRQLWAHIRRIEDFWTTLKEIEPGAVARLAGAAAAHQWDVIFITARPSSAGETTQRQSQRWLQAHGFELPSVYVVSGSRGNIAAALTLDAVIDDRPEHCLDVATDSHAKPFLVWREDPATVPPGASRMGIQAVSTVEEAVRRLEALRPAAARDLLGRLKGALGL